MKFPLGQVVMTMGVAEFIEENQIDNMEVGRLVGRHVTGDYGDMPKEDKALNDVAIMAGSRIMSSYELNDRKIWIITEADRSATTILFPDEY